MVAVEWNREPARAGTGVPADTSNAASVAPRRGLRSPWRRTISTDWLGRSGRDGFAAPSGT